MTAVPAVSIILPTRNRAARLPNAIASIREQTLREWELIVVDHASDDETKRIVGEAAADDPRIRYVYLAEPAGPSAPRNAGLEAVRGDFISFIDDDDRWLPRKAEVQLAALRSRPELGAVSCFFEFHDERTGRTTRYRGPITYSARAMLWFNFPGGLMGMLRGDAFSTSLHFDESLTTCEDWDFWLQRIEERPMVTLPDVLYRYNLHGAVQATFTSERSVNGRVAFVEKNAARMSAVCRGFHDARVRVMREPDTRGRVGVHLRFLATLPPRVRRIVATHSLYGRLGWMIGDPGLASRRLCRDAERN
ncbi:MAG: glycosyltransferase family A protein [Actinomycetota bacterium]